eukprot:gene25417-30690_t
MIWFKCLVRSDPLRTFCSPIDPSALPMARSGVYRDVDPALLQQRSTAPRGHPFPPSFPSHQTGYSVTPPAAAPAPSHGEADRYLPPYIVPGRGAELSHWYPGSPHGPPAARPAPHPSAFHAAAQQQQQQQQQAPVTFDPSPRGPPFSNSAYPFPGPSPTYRGRGEFAFPAHGDDYNAFVGRSTAERLHAFPAQHQQHAAAASREEGYFLPPPARSADRDYASLMGAVGGSGSGKTSVSGAPERESEERYAPASVFGAAADFRPPGSVQTPSTLDADVSTNTSSNKSNQAALEEPADRTRYFHTFAQRTSSSSLYTSESAATGSGEHNATPPLPGALPGLEDAGLHHSTHFHEHGHW